MTTHSRIAAFLSTSALCLGLAAAPSAFAAKTDRTRGGRKVESLSVWAPRGFFISVIWRKKKAGR